jgi:hypothetical protein
MNFRKLVVAQIKAGEPVVGQMLDEGEAVLLIVDLNSNEDLGAHSLRHSITEFGEAAVALTSTQRTKTSCRLGDFHGKHRFSLLTELSPLCDEAQSFEIHVGPAGHPNKTLPFEVSISHILFQTSDRKRSSWFKD